MMMMMIIIIIIIIIVRILTLECQLTPSCGQA